ncbi:MAG TPA: hypothetical protein VGH87_20570, partial [Polyangiaceae bacterium]
MGWVLLVALTALAFFASLALALRTKPEGRAELGIATALIFTALVCAPIYVLGLLEVLYRPALAALSAATSLAILAACGRREWRKLLETCVSETRSLARMVNDALNEAYAARSVVFVGLSFSLALVGIALVLTWLIQFNGWDDFIYHTPMVGFAIQNHGIGIVPLPHAEAVQGNNGYPRLLELFTLWFVFFTDRTLMELPVAMFTMPLMLVTYAIARRYATRVHAMGLAVVVLLMPHVWHTLCSTYNDVEVAFFLGAALYYTSRPIFRVEHAILAIVAMTLVIGSKVTWLTFVPPIAMFTLPRLLRLEISWARRLGVLAFGLVMFGSLAWLHLGRNWIHFHNPFWPFAFHSDKLHLDFPGFRSYDALASDPPFMASYTPPSGGMGDMFRRGYGQAVAWIGFPLAAIAIAVWLFVSVRDLVRTRRFGDTWMLGLVVVPAVISIKTSPTLMQPRYNVHIVIALLAAGAWVLLGSRWRRTRENLIGAMMALSIIPFFWLGDANVTTVDEEMEHVFHPFTSSRQYSEHRGFDLLTKEKYEEIHAGDEVALSDGIGFPGGLWNFDFSNRVDYVPFKNRRQFLDDLDALHAKWVDVCKGTGGESTVASDARWELIGPTNDGLP